MLTALTRASLLPELCSVARASCVTPVKLGGSAAWLLKLLMLLEACAAAVARLLDAMLRSVLL